MSNTNQPAANTATRPETSLRQAVHRHRQAVTAGTRALQEWTAASAEKDRVLLAWLADIRQRLSTVLTAVPGSRKPATARPRPRLRVVGLADA